MGQHGAAPGRGAAAAARLGEACACAARRCGFGGWGGWLGRGLGRDGGGSERAIGRPDGWRAARMRAGAGALKEALLTSGCQTASRADKRQISFQILLESIPVAGW